MIAVNKGGESPPSDPSDMHTVKFKKLPPRIDRTNLKTTTVKVGRRVHLDVDVKGEPEPETKWYDEDGREVKMDGEHFTVEHGSYNTKLTIADGQRKQSGKYKIVAKNEHGQDQEWVEIVFLGPPSRPMG